MIVSYFDALRAVSQPIRAAEWVMTLDPMRRLLAALDDPQRAYPAVVVTGSTGKGSTCLRIAQSLGAAGATVGIYTSPHLHSFRERFAVLDAEKKGDVVGAQRAAPLRLITQAEFVEIASLVLDAARTLDHAYSTFEYATAIALVWFARQQIDTAVLEIGIGGRFDAVNAVANQLAVFTPIDAEHVSVLGGSLESVAWHKAGIIQPGGRALTVPQTPEVLAALEREAAEKGAALEIVDDPVLAVGRCGFQTRPADAHTLRLPGRLEQVTVGGRAVIIDGGHTPSAARYLRRFIGDAPSIRLIVGMLRDKNVPAYLNTFDAPNIHMVYTRAPGDRALTPDALLERYRPAQASIELVPSLEAALDQVHHADEPLIVVAGSLRMAAAAREAFGLLSPDELDEARRTRAIFEGAAYQAKLPPKPHPG